MSILSTLMQPTTKTQAAITVLTVTVFVVCYIAFTDFFITCSILISFLFPIFVLVYYGSKMLERGLKILLSMKA